MAKHQAHEAGTHGASHGHKNSHDTGHGNSETAPGHNKSGEHGNNHH
jgi:hypothetical protein